MIAANTMRVTAPSNEYSDEELRQLLLRSEKESRFIERPANPTIAKRLRRTAHSIVADRLLQARNRSGINNDRINQIMHGLYMERRRDPKAWTFTNSVSTRLAFLPDDEEVEMLAQVLPTSEEIIGLHLKVIPWALEDQKAEAQKRARRGSSVTISDTGEAAPVPKDMPTPPAGSQQINAGDLKISHQGSTIHVHGKVWCDRKTAQRLRMIVPLKLLQQAHGDNPWAYEIKGPVHNYQLYNLMHVLYGAPRVLQVQLD